MFNDSIILNWIVKQAIQRKQGILYVLYSIGSWALDYGLYGLLVIYFDAFVAVMIMTPLMLCIDVITLIRYSRSKSDWFGIEYIKSFDTYEGKNIFKQLIKFANQQNLYLKVILLSIEFNPFLITVYVRPTSGNRRLIINDWKVFSLSFIVGSTYWAIVMGGGITLLKEIILSPLGQKVIESAYCIISTVCV